MTREELRQLIADVQRRQSELDNVKVKAARGGTPKRLYEPLSAFANRTGGGVLLFRLDESKDFSIVGVGDVQRLQEEITNLPSAEIEPALRPHFLVDEIDGETVAAVEVEEISAAQKPCFYKQAGLPKGTYLRVGNTNRQMTEYADSRRFEGPVPEMITQAENYVLGAMRKAVLIDGVFRRELPEYPFEALREALANAVAHRDYSPYVRGSYIQVRMFADRPELQSPGGLFGNVTEENLEEEHSTRNAQLMRMMEDMHVVDNRGSGISAMLQAMREANLEPPRFDDRRASFQVTFRNYTLMNPDAIAGLNQFAHIQLNDRQRLALVYLRQHESITNGDYRRLNRVDAMMAGQELRGLVQAGLVDQQGASRWTCYTLRISREHVAQGTLPADEEKMLAYVREHGSINNAECRELLGVDLHHASYLLKRLAAEGS